MVVAKSEIQRVWREEVGMVTKGKHESICEIEKMLSVLPVKVIHEPGDENV